MTKPPDLAADLLRAAEILDREAKILHSCHTAAGKWPARWAPTKRDHDEMRRLARRLRRFAGTI